MRERLMECLSARQPDGLTLVAALLIFRFHSRPP